MSAEILIPMTSEEARACVADIKAGFQNLRRRVLDLYDREGWRALGYTSWRECVVAEFQQSQAYLYRTLSAAQIEKEISPMGEIGIIPERQLRVLAPLEPEERGEVWSKAVETAPNGKLTVSHIEKTAARVLVKTQTAQALKATEIFNVILADCPWEYNNTGVNGAALKHYPTMPTQEICALPQRINLKIAENAVLFLWATNPLLEDALAVVRAWGFRYKTNICWVKTRNDEPNIGSGFYVRGSHELLFICVRGSFTPLVSAAVSSVVQSPLEEHSRKPDRVYEIIETLYPGCNYIELFARRPREGWKSYGNEVRV